MSAATTPTPDLPSLQIAAIHELAERAQWVCWREERDESGRLTKRPYVPSGQRKASSTDPATWSTFADCAQAFGAGRFDGIGYVFSKDDPYVGVDLDDCLGEDGRPNDLAVETVAALNSYTEKSPSGRGLHILARGELPPVGRKKDALGVEMYSSSRYFTVSGTWWPDSPETIEERTPQLEALHRRIFSTANEAPKARTNGSGKITEGDRHNALVKCAASLRKQGISEGAVLAATLAFNSERCDPPKSEDEVRRIAEWSARTIDDETSEPVELERISFSGARLLSLLDRPEPEPVVAGVPVAGHLTLWVAPSYTGKSTLAYCSAMARVAGVAAWAGAPAPPVGRVLIYSIDEAPEQVVRRMRGLAMFHPAGRPEQYADNLVVIGPDREIETGSLDSLRFTDAGLATLGQWLADAEREGRPFAEVFIDAYADVLPLGESENSNEEATRIGGALEALAVRTGAAVVLLHHAGKPKADAGDNLPDVRFLGRGASALAAKARVVSSLEAVSGMPHLRRIRTITNLGRSPRPALFEVCSPESDTEELLYFRPHDPEAAYVVEDLIGEGESISTTGLAWRLAGKEPESGKSPPGEMKKLATQLRERWRRAGRIDVFEGQRKAKMMKRKDSPHAA